MLEQFPLAAWRPSPPVDWRVVGRMIAGGSGLDPASRDTHRVSDTVPSPSDATQAVNDSLKAPLNRRSLHQLLTHPLALRECDEVRCDHGESRSVAGQFGG